MQPHHRRHERIKAEGLIDAVCQARAVVGRAVEAALEEELRLVDDAYGHVSLML